MSATCYITRLSAYLLPGYICPMGILRLNPARRCWNVKCTLLYFSGARRRSCVRQAKRAKWTATQFSPKWNGCLKTESTTSAPILSGNRLKKIIRLFLCFKMSGVRWWTSFYAKWTNKWIPNLPRCLNGNTRWFAACNSSVRRFPGRFCAWRSLCCRLI